MLTFFTIPKPFVGRIGEIQRNAIASWRALDPAVQVVLVGDDPGVADAAREAGVDHVGGVRRNHRGTPRLDSAFALTETVASSRLWCLVNADIVLLDDFAEAVRRVSARFDPFVMIGECRDLALGPGVRIDDEAFRRQLRQRALAEGRLRGWAALDYFVFPRGLFDPIPPFLIGRACFDNWLVWRAREREHPVVDATRAVVAVHQSHDYAHVPGGQEEAYYGEEARLNEDMAGGRAHIYSLHDATHRLYTRGRPVPYLLSIGRARERVRVAKASYDVRKRSETSVQKALRLLAVMPKPQELTTRLLNELAVRPDTSLTALYGERGSGPAPVGHVHWFPRSIRLPIKPDYPINWAIMNSFRGLAPHGMLVAGWDTFATQSAIAWCRAKGVPYLLVVDTVPPSQPTSVIARMFRRLAIAGASTVLTTSAATEDWLFAHGCDRSRVQRLLTAPDAAASALTQLLRDAPRTRQPRDVDTSTVRARRRLFVHRGS